MALWLLTAVFLFSCFFFPPVHYLILVFSGSFLALRLSCYAREDFALRHLSFSSVIMAIEHILYRFHVCVLRTSAGCCCAYHDIYTACVLALCSANIVCKTWSFHQSIRYIKEQSSQRTKRTWHSVCTRHNSGVNEMLLDIQNQFAIMRKTITTVATESIKSKQTNWAIMFHRI